MPEETVQEKRAAVGVQAPVVETGLTYASVTDHITGIAVDQRHPRAWYLPFMVGLLLTLVLLYSVVYLFAKGVGIWGINVPVGWGFAIINFVWWIGIGHAGTLISAILVLVRQDWRTSINRFAEAMTLFAVACAGLFPILHLGRPGLFYYLLPYPNTMDMWPQFRSPLTWDVMAVLTYGTVSLLFWYLGLIPDLATARDRSTTRFKQRIFGALSLGWRGAARHWHRHQTAYLLMAGLATPLVISVHSIVGTDFAFSILPGWHSTIFPPYFVAGAIFSGFAMVLTLVIPIRKLYGFEGMITMRHMDFCAKMMLVTGLLTSYGYLNEAFFAWYSASEPEMYMMANRMTGPYAHLFWTLIACNLVAIQTLWFRKLRHNLVFLWVLSLAVNVGMWLERYVIVVTSLHRDFLPSSWDMYHGTIWDWAVFAGTIGFFLLGMFIFVRFVPMISMSEMRELIHDQRHEGEQGGVWDEEPEAGPAHSPYTGQETDRFLGGTGGGDS